MLLRAVFLMLMLFCYGGCATMPRPGQPSTGGVPVSTICQKYSLDCSWDGVTHTVSMNYKGKLVRAMVGSSLVLVDSTRFSLSSPLRRKSGSIMLPSDFERVVILPTVENMAGELPKVPSRIGKVVLDPGHGGKDPGAIGYSGLKEKDITLDIVRRLRDELVKAGVDVVITREKDEALALDRRTEIASRPDVELFVSIHANSTTPDHKRSISLAHGIEVYYIGALNADDLDEQQRQLNAKKLCGEFKMQGSSEEARKIVLSMLYNYKMSEAPGMAERMARNLSRAVEEHSRGAKSQRYFVLRNTLVPAILIEVGFLSNPGEERRLKEPSYRQKMAVAISRSISEYLYATGK
ncbi:MAG: hypothetical protein HGA80_00595 [Candidatus Omnitrophica bacterium]|nr:hypothetical protein [Candidatus Omnitrophota bacterium]